MFTYPHLNTGGLGEVSGLHNRPVFSLPRVEIRLRRQGKSAVFLKYEPFVIQCYSF